MVSRPLVPMFTFGAGLVAISMVDAFVATEPSTKSNIHSALPRRVESSRSGVKPLKAVNGIWNTGNDFGKGDFRYYDGLESFMSPFPDEDRDQYPELFVLPKGVYEVPLPTPCGIIFEEIEPKRGVYVADLVKGGNAERQGAIHVGDVLVALTAVQVSGAKWERRLLPARNFGFDMVVNAIGSNEMKWGCENVILMVERPGEADSKVVDKFLEYHEPPNNTPWKM